MVFVVILFKMSMLALGCALAIWLTLRLINSIRSL